MADKVFKITEIVKKNGHVYTVGGAPAHFGNGDGALVEAITYNRADNAYNKGLQLSGASYTVTLEGGEKRIVKDEAVEEIGGKWFEARKAAPAEPVPDLPEA